MLEKLAFALLAFISLTGLLFFVFSSLVDAPIVLVSSFSEECVRVDSNNPKFTCDNLPDFYFTMYTR